MSDQVIDEDVSEVGAALARELLDGSAFFEEDSLSSSSLEGDEDGQAPMEALHEKTSAVALQEHVNGIPEKEGVDNATDTLTKVEAKTSLLQQKDASKLDDESHAKTNSTMEEDHDLGEEIGDGDIDNGTAPNNKGDDNGNNSKHEENGDTDVYGTIPESKSEDEENTLASDQFTSPYLKWYNPVKNFCGSIVNDMRFQIIIVLLIIINALFMGIATYDFVEDNPKAKKAFQTVDLVFLVIFTIESTLQLGYHGYQLFYDGWLTFDFLVVILSWSLSGAQIFRAIRVFRAFRLVARLGVLKDLVNAIVAVLPRIGSIMLLFTLVLYIYSVLCTVLFGNDRYGEDGENNYFGRLDYSLFTLFQFVTLEGWGDISREVMALYPWAVAVFLSFLCVSSFILYSLVVAVVCDAVAVVEHPDIALKKFEEKMQREQTETKKRVRKVKASLSELSEFQMDILLSVQMSLMKYESFRDDAQISQLQANQTIISM